MQVPLQQLFKNSHPSRPFFKGHSLADPTVLEAFLAKDGCTGIYAYQEHSESIGLLRERCCSWMDFLAVSFVVG